MNEEDRSRREAEVERGRRVTAFVSDPIFQEAFEATRKATIASTAWRPEPIRLLKHNRPAT